MHYVESHREGKDYHEPIERPAELVLIISTLHVVVNFAVKATLTDVYISRCALMQYDVTKSPLSFSSLSISYIGQGDTEDITRSTQYTDSENFTPEVADVKKRSPTSLLKYCRLLMDRSEIIEPLCTALGLDFSIVQEAITAFDLIHVFNSYSPSSSIQL